MNNAITDKHINKLILYWDNGWRAGFLNKIRKKKLTAIITPIGPKNKKTHKLEIKLEDVKQPD